MFEFFPVCCMHLKDGFLEVELLTPRTGLLVILETCDQMDHQKSHANQNVVWQDYLTAFHQELFKCQPP